LTGEVARVQVNSDIWVHRTREANF